MEVGLVVGKFFPFHKGHLELIKFAKKNCDNLVVFMCLEDRFDYPIDYIDNMSKELEDEIFITYKENKELSYIYSDDDSEVSKEWAEAVEKHLVGYKITKVFSSEDYSINFSKYLGANNFIFDKARIKIPISATEIRKNLYKNWKYLTNSSKRSFQKHIVVTGVEGVGKTTLVKSLCKQLNNISMVPEFGSTYCEAVRYPENETDFNKIRETQNTYENKAKKSLNPIVLSDTNWVTTDAYQTLNIGSHTSKGFNSPDLYILLTDVLDNYSTDSNRLKKKERLVLKSILEGKIKTTGTPIITCTNMSIKEIIKNLTRWLEN